MLEAACIQLHCNRDVSIAFLVEINLPSDVPMFAAERRQLIAAR